MVGVTSAAPSTSVVISQVYGGGGNTGAPFQNDFVELHNISAAPVSITGWSVQYNSASGTNPYQAAALSGTIPAGGYFLVKLAAGTTITAPSLPPEDATGNINLSGTSGKVALVNGTAPLAAGSASDAAGIVDFVGFGTANTFEGTVAPAPSNAKAIVRADSGSTDTDKNSTDFIVGDPAPRNKDTAAFIPDNPGPPIVSALTPANGSTGAAVDAPLKVVFNKKIAKGTGNITVNLANGTTAFTIDVATTAVVVSEYTATITLPSSLTQGASYYVNMSAGTFKDLAGNNFAGITGTSAWAFTAFTPDVIPPTIVSLVPTNGAIDVNPVLPLKITFSEPVAVPNFSGPLILIKNPDNTVAATLDPSLFGGNGEVSVSGNVATLTVPALTPLVNGTLYHLEIGEGAFEDLSGNKLAAITGATTWSFTTIGVPSLTATPYTQTFSTYVSAATLPLGWSYSGAPNFVSAYQGTWGSITVDPANPNATLGGFKGNASVFGYHHSSITNTSLTPLVQILTLKNATGAPITALSVSYKGRIEIPANTRIPTYTVNVAGSDVSALAYSTTSGDNAQRQASVTGLNVPDGATFQIKWSSNYPSGAGSARQIGISDVVVVPGTTLFAPTVANIEAPLPKIGASLAEVDANVIGDGGQTITARGFVYSLASANTLPVLNGPGVTSVPDGTPAAGAYSAILTGLTSATTYVVRGYATNATGTSYSVTTTFTTQAPSPVFTSSYTQDFVNYDGTNPAGWTALSDANPPVQGFVKDSSNVSWGTQLSTGGFLGLDSTPGVLGYRHSGSTGKLTVTLRLVNGTGSKLTSLYVSYLGRVNDTAEERIPSWTVSVAGSAPVTALAYSTGPGVDTKLGTTVPVSIEAGAEFAITWISDRGTGANSSKQIGLSQVNVALQAPTGDTYSTWAATNVNNQTANLDFDGDGIANGAEYFMGTPGNAFTPNPGILAGKVTWPRAANTTITSFKVETSINLTTWQDASVSYPANLSITASQVQFTMPTTPTKLFVRLSVVP